jgi:hypothetical protein
MVYIAPVPRSNQQKQQAAAPAAGGGRAAGKGKQQEPHQQQLQLPLPDRSTHQAAGRNQQRKPQQQPAAKAKARPDTVKSKQDLLQELSKLTSTLEIEHVHALVTCSCAHDGSATQCYVSRTICALVCSCCHTGSDLCCCMYSAATHTCCSCCFVPQTDRQSGTHWCYSGSKQH